MRITDVHASYPRYEPPRPGWRASMWQIAVEIETDAGLRGLGVGGGVGAAVYIINQHFRPLLIGHEVVPAQCYDLLFKASLPYGRKGVALMAISGVDLALWDLVGKQQGKSICRVLGGEPRAVPAYATGRNVEEYLKQGFRAIKLARPPGPEAGEEGIRWTLDWLRKARGLGGDDIDLMVDAWMDWDVEFTLKMADLMAPFNVRWIEEPIIPDDYKGYERLCREVTTTKIAHGEHEFSEHGLRELIDRGAVHILQPDFTWCGGMTPVLRIRRWAQNYGVPIIPHRGSEAWAYPFCAAYPSPPAPLPLANSPMRAEGLQAGEGRRTAAEPPSPARERSALSKQSQAGEGRRTAAEPPSPAREPSALSKQSQAGEGRRTAAEPPSPAREPSALFEAIASGRGAGGEGVLAEVVIGDGEFPGGDPPLVGAPRVEDGFVIGEDRPGFGVELAL